MRNYAAITIGPIVDTLSLAGSPGTLWCASTMFSLFAGDLCKSILTEIPGSEIVAPAYDNAFINTDGIGRFHDRIFFTCNLEHNALADKLNTLCNNAKKTLAKHISEALGQQDEPAQQKTERYISGYIQLSWMIADKATSEANNQNCILNLSQYLNCMELNTRRLPEETENPVMRLLSGTSESNNYYIYRRRNNKINACWLIPENPADGVFQLLKNGAVRDIGDVANPFDSKDGRKAHNYFAVVQSDGDNIGSFLASCAPEQVRGFSKCCIAYAEEAAKAVGEYGGLTIYAGGDDLLFLAPLIGKDEKTLLTLCTEISCIFNQHYETFGKTIVSEGKADKVKMPTLSFGISVNYENSPLYEALEDARYLLFERAKTGEKNQIALSMHKHSGQSIFVLLPNSSAEDAPTTKLSTLIDESLKKKLETTDDALHSVVYQLEVFRRLFIESRRNNMNTQNLYDNLFDSEAHLIGRDYINHIKKLEDSVAAFPTCCADDGKASITNEPVDVITSMLRFAKLFTEREARRE